MYEGQSGIVLITKDKIKFDSSGSKARPQNEFTCIFPVDFYVNLLAVMSVLLWLLTGFEYPEAEDAVVNLKTNCVVFQRKTRFQKGLQRTQYCCCGSKIWKQSQTRSWLLRKRRINRIVN